MESKKEIIQSVEYIFENTKRIHGNSEALDWQKIAIHKSVSYILSELVPLPLDVPTDEEIKEYARTESIVEVEFVGEIIEYQSPISEYYEQGAKWAIEQIIERNQK